MKTINSIPQGADDAHTDPKQIPKLIDLPVYNGWLFGDLVAKAMHEERGESFGDASLVS